VIDEQESWQNRTLAPFYPFLFVDCLFVPIKRDYETKECAVYNILGIRVDGRKEILGLWIQERANTLGCRFSTNSRRTAFRKLASFLWTGCHVWKRGARAIFPEVVVQRCIVHLIRNSLKYVPTRDYKLFASHLKKIYGAPSLKACRVEFERF